MTDMAKKRQEIAKEIRALLMSSPAALTIEELRRDFHNFMDRPIPFRDLGYSSLEDMLHDMTEVINITYKRGMMCLEVIPDDTTRHIAKLVSKQKISNPQKYATMRRGPPPRKQQRQLPSTLPHYIRKNISELFRSYSNGLPLTHFDTAYSRRFGSMFSFSRLGFVSLKELLYSIPDIVMLKEFQAGEWRVLPAKAKAPDGNWRDKKKQNETRFQESWNTAKELNTQNPQYSSLLPYRVEPQEKCQKAQQSSKLGRGKGRGICSNMYMSNIYKLDLNTMYT